VKFFTEDEKIENEFVKAGTFRAEILADTEIEADTEIHVLIEGTPTANPD
jgi:hypothetical protein